MAGRIRLDRTRGVRYAEFGDVSTLGVGRAPLGVAVGPGCAQTSFTPRADRGESA